MAFIKLFFVFCNSLLLLSLGTLCIIQVTEGSKAEYVTCGSILKLINKNQGVRLHSHDVKYGSGSGQQSVTGVEDSDDHNSHWLVLAVEGEVCKRGAPVKCGSKIRLRHVSTKKYLHSHYFDSPLSGKQAQEVSCYGGDDGLGDGGDNWIVVCNDDFWRRDGTVKLQHIDTAVYLAASGRTFGRPISGQAEIVGTARYGAYSDWQAKEGLFVHPSDPMQFAQHAVHTEL